MEVQYFSHDYNARRDRKMVRLRLQMGYEGVGIFWSIVEYLYENGNECRREDVDIMADDLRVEEGTLRRVLEEFGLFESDGERYWSESIARRLEERSKRSKVQSENAKKRVRGEVRERKDGGKDGGREGSEGEEGEEWEEVERNGWGLAEPNGEVGWRLAEPNGDKIKEKEKEKDINTPIAPKGARTTPRRVAAMKFDFSVEARPEWMMAEMAGAFKEWIEYKRGRRSGYANERTARTCYEELMRWACGSVEAATRRIRVAIANNWQGLVFDDGSGRRAAASVGNVGTLIGRRITEF
ncbi:MAG: DUF4373 domain-containing protein [Bacteroidales bacterium]|nr:DUF4373 domain-containing protein [Bacteroidales bacterium]